MQQVSIGICRYPHALKSAIYGFEEMFNLANHICETSMVGSTFTTEILDEEALPSSHFDVILIPPSNRATYYLTPNRRLTRWLYERHVQGSVLASACAGAFILASTGIVKNRTVTTHWGLASQFKAQFPAIALESNEILIDHDDILTAGGMMSWLDLGFALVEKFSSRAVMRQLGKALVVDTAPREQRFYQQFNPSFSHGDKAIVSIQHAIGQHYASPLSITSLADQFNLTARTLQRRFQKATGETPNQYIQRIRIQKACDLLEDSNYSFEHITNQIGYQDVSACRRVFIKIMGLTPKAFRARFSHEQADLSCTRDNNR